MLNSAACCVVGLWLPLLVVFLSGFTNSVTLTSYDNFGKILRFEEFKNSILNVLRDFAVKPSVLGLFFLLVRDFLVTTQCYFWIFKNTYMLACLRERQRKKSGSLPKSQWRPRLDQSKAGSLNRC